jgi:DNA-binding transcriptional MerR regulator
MDVLNTSDRYGAEPGSVVMSLSLKEIRELMSALQVADNESMLICEVTSDILFDRLAEAEALIQEG